jgi:hypothetical protein
MSIIAHRLKRNLLVFLFIRMLFFQDETENEKYLCPFKNLAVG